MDYGKMTAIAARIFLVLGVARPRRPFANIEDMGGTPTAAPRARPKIAFFSPPHRPHHSQPRQMMENELGEVRDGGGSLGLRCERSNGRIHIIFIEFFGYDFGRAAPTHRP